MTLLLPFINKNHSHYRYFYKDIFVNPPKRQFFLATHPGIPAPTPISSDELLIF